MIGTEEAIADIGADVAAIEMHEGVRKSGLDRLNSDGLPHREGVPVKSPTRATRHGQPANRTQC